MDLVELGVFEVVLAEFDFRNTEQRHFHSFIERTSSLLMPIMDCPRRVDKYRLEVLNSSSPSPYPLPKRRGRASWRCRNRGPLGYLARLQEGCLTTERHGY